MVVARKQCGTRLVVTQEEVGDGLGSALVDGATAGAVEGQVAGLRARDDVGAGVATVTRYVTKVSRKGE